MRLLPVLCVEKYFCPHQFIMKCINDLFFFIQMQTDNHSTYLNYQSICPSSVLRFVVYCSHVISLVRVDYWKTLDCICKCKACNLRVKTLQSFLHRRRERGPAFPEFLIFILTDSQLSLMSSEESKTMCVRIYYVQVCMYIYSISVQCLHFASVSLEWCVSQQLIIPDRRVVTHINIIQ